MSDALKQQMDTECSGQTRTRLDHNEAADSMHGDLLDAALSRMARLEAALAITGGSVHDDRFKIAKLIEELAMIFPDTSIEQATDRAEGIRRRIEELPIPLGGRPLGKITASFGTAGYPRHGTGYQQIMRAADAALYQAKAEGRNRVVVTQNAQAKVTDDAEESIACGFDASAKDAA